MTSRTCRRCEISKKLTWNPALMAKNTPLFLFPYMGHSLQIFAWGMPLHAHVFSFTHNAVVLSAFRCVHPENQTKIFRFSHFYESKQTSLTQDLKWSLNNVARYKYSISPGQTDLLLCTILLLPPLKSPSKHGRWRSSLLLYSISMVSSTCPLYFCRDRAPHCARAPRHSSFFFLKKFAPLLWKFLDPPLDAVL